MAQLKYETLEELVEKRKGYKYLRKDRTSPYQKYKYVFRKGKVFKLDNLDTDINNDCGAGWNLATLPWILKDDGNLLKDIIVEFSIPKEAEIVVPKNSNGKFRTDIIQYEKIYDPQDLFPFLRKITKKLKAYKPINPIQATKLPPKNKILKIMDQVGDQVRAQVRAQVGAQVRAQVGNQVWAQVRAQVRAQVYITSYFAVKEFLGLDYEHPVFDLIRLGVFVVRVMGNFKVFGKNGKLLGEIENK